MKNLLLALSLIAVAPVVAADEAEASKPGYLSQAKSIVLNTICSPWTVTKELFGQVRKGYNAYAPNRQTVGHVAKRTAQLSAVVFAALMLNKLGKKCLAWGKLPAFIQGSNPVVSPIKGIATLVSGLYNRVHGACEYKQRAGQVFNFLFSLDQVTQEEHPDAEAPKAQ